MSGSSRARSAQEDNLIVVGFTQNGCLLTKLFILSPKSLRILHSSRAGTRAENCSNY